MALWSDYMKDVQRLLNDSKQELFDPFDLNVYINKARREVAMRSACVRLDTPISGSIINATVTAGGSGYTNPALLISPPDFPSGQGPYPNGSQATGTVNMSGGVITGVNITYGGYGYFNPIFTVNDPTGTGCTITPTLSFFNQVTAGKEVYPFSGINLSAFPGYESIYAVRSVSIIYANYRYSLPCYSFSTYQAYIRSYPYQFSYVPTMCCQFGRGTSGSFYMYPLPSQTYQVEFDAMCLPSDILSDGDVDVIPEPYNDAVPFLAAYYGYLEKQNGNSARSMKSEFDEWVRRYGAYTLPGRVSNPYGRFVWLLTAGLSAATLLGSLLC